MNEPQRAEIIMADLKAMADRTPDARDRITLSAAAQFIRDAANKPSWR